jgi:superfamily II DNA/RNA helicase
VVATPGRLWRLMSAHSTILQDLSGLRMFILDEADRMLAKGHFPELQSILQHIHRSRDALEARATAEASVSEFVLHKLQVLLFSATLTMQATGRELHTKTGKEFKKWQKRLLHRANEDGNSMQVCVCVCLCVCACGCIAL